MYFVVRLVLSRLVIIYRQSFAYITIVGNFVEIPKDMIKGIIGAVIGDVAGSTREAKPVSSKRFKTFTSGSTVTDDTVLTIAVAQWMLDRDGVDIAQ